MLHIIYKIILLLCIILYICIVQLQLLKHFVLMKIINSFLFYILHTYKHTHTHKRINMHL